MKVKLVKEPDNEVDSEAIKVEMPGIGQIGYVANSPYTVIGESMSAGRICLLHNRITPKWQYDDNSPTVIHQKRSL